MVLLVSDLQLEAILMEPLAPELLAELNQAIANHQFNLVADEIRRNACECYAMVAIEEDNYSATGNTRFGGDPDLPDAIPWPTDEHDSKLKYCNFIAQINLAELPSLAAGRALPSTGLLYIFLRRLISAADPVSIDVSYFDGDMSMLRRRTLPDDVEFCDPYSTGLTPQRVTAVPAVSLATFRKDFKGLVEQEPADVNGESGEIRLIHLQSDLEREGQIGQLLGFANGHEGGSLYQNVVLSRLAKRELVFDDWDSMEEYEACIESWRDNDEVVRMYEGIRGGVIWLTDNRQMITDLVNEWRLLLKVCSNTQMNLTINDFDPLYCFIRSDDLSRRDFSDVAGEVTQG